MARLVGEPVEVRVQARPPGAQPVQFLWRGRLYLVRAVLAHWVEARAWWRPPAAPGAPGASGPPGSRGVPPTAPAGPPPGSPAVVALSGGAEREVWRVEAGSGRESSLGVYDLAFDPAVDPVAGPVPGSAVGPAVGSGRWTLARAHD